tara:strand:+ start:4217 stop:4642 length:426 start_codon:yes stop_codon:yes gene_type:complete
MQKEIAQFIPILLIFLFLSFFQSMKQFSYTSFGKLIAVICILFYSCLDIYMGVFVCLLVIYYYQDDLTTNLLNNQEDEKPKQSNNYINDFKKTNCNENTLTFKGMNVKNEMTEHIFPQIHYLNERCNPCSSNCKFSIRESK